MLDLQWLYARASDAARLCEEIYSKDMGHKKSVQAFLEKLLQLSEAQSIWIYHLEDDAQSFIKLAGCGAPLLTSVARADIERTLDFAEYCNTYIIYPNCWIEKFSSAVVTEQHLPTCMLSTFVIDSDPVIIVYGYGNPSNDILQRNFSNIASQELLHLYRSSELREQLKISKSLAEVANLNVEKQEILFNVLFNLKNFFGADGASIIEPREDRNNQLVFEKTYVERARKGLDNFTSAEGIAHYCVTNDKALLITVAFPDVANPYCTGLAFDPEQLTFGQGKRLSIETTRAPHSAEDEKSLMYFPFKYGDKTSAIKVSDFTQCYGFDLQDLRALRVFAHSIAALFGYIHAIAQLRAEIDSRDAQAQMLDIADNLFFYREITLGIFHQVSNHLATLASEFLILETLASSWGDNATELNESIREAKGHTRLARELIAKSQQRGLRLAPVEQTCELIQDVIRPAIEYAKQRVQKSKIEIRYSLSNEEYKVKLDIELAKECMINLLNNAIWAVKCKSGTKKEIFIAVRKTAEGRSVRINIEDSGIGIEPDIFKKLFTPGVTTRADGTGLGLYFTRKLIQHFSGTVNIVRSKPGSGTTVELILPLGIAI